MWSYKNYNNIDFLQRAVIISEAAFPSFCMQPNGYDHGLLTALSMMCGVLHWATVQLQSRRIYVKLRIWPQRELLFMWSSEFT